MDYLAVNRANWDSRAPIHARNYGIDRLLADPSALSDVVRFDLPRLGRLDGLDVLHLQCHIGTDTLSLHRLGGRVTGLDLSPASLAEARKLAGQAGAAIDYVESDVYSAPEALAGRSFDVVYTGIGAIGWLPSIRRWAEVASALLRPGGQLFIREGHPVLWSSIVVRLGEDPEDRVQQPWVTGAGGLSAALELPYFEQAEPLVWHEEHTYAGDDLVSSPEAAEWNHGMAEIITALLEAGLQLTSLTEHDSVPWEALPGLMTLDEESGEYRLTDRPERLPASYTLTATKP
ncbi:MAG: class I SAM-dependent methyltransferase [Propionicimonas sp.]|uniref:class I SAM-dependent methyltransferase n=1 Tax=Propionicimonas sp. TaxID=1955623 RepID=UPI003D0C04ED